MRGRVSCVRRLGFILKAVGGLVRGVCRVYKDTVSLKEVAGSMVGGWMGRLLTWSPFSFISVAPATLAGPGHGHFWLPLVDEPRIGPL